MKYKDISDEDADYVLERIGFDFNVQGRMKKECAIAFFEQASECWNGEQWNISADTTLDLIQWAKEKGYDIPKPKSI